MTEAERLLDFLEGNRSVQLILERAGELGLPNWYLGAGGVTQTVWNAEHGFAPEFGIKDYDLVYYDAADTSRETENAFIRKGAELFRDVPVPVEIVNEARVYLWYEKDFGRPIAQYKSVEEAISTFPTTATAVGVRRVNGKTEVFAPLGLDDLLNLTVRANKALITEKIYRDKVESWIKKWPKLKVISWDNKQDNLSA